MPLDVAEAQRWVNAFNGKAAYAAPTTPVMARLVTALGSASAAGTEVANSGGSAYAPQSWTAATPASGTSGVLANNQDMVFTNMPDTTAASVKGVEWWDSAGTPRRICYASLTTPKTTNLGDSLRFTSAQLQNFAT